MAHEIHKCPACGETNFVLERLRCTECGTAVEGRFAAGKLGGLPREHQDFIEVFVRCRGNIKDVERVLGISYPTVRGRLDRAIHALGYESEQTGSQRKEILRALENQELTPEQALSALKDMAL